MAATTSNITVKNADMGKKRSDDTKGDYPSLTIGATLVPKRSVIKFFVNFKRFIDLAVAVKSTIDPNLRARAAGITYGQFVGYCLRLLATRLHEILVSRGESALSHDDGPVVPTRVYVPREIYSALACLGDLKINDLNLVMQLDITVETIRAILYAAARISQLPDDLNVRVTIGNMWQLGVPTRLAATANAAGQAARLRVLALYGADFPDTAPGQNAARSLMVGAVPTLPQFERLLSYVEMHTQFSTLLTSDFPAGADTTAFGGFVANSGLDPANVAAFNRVLGGTGWQVITTDYEILNGAPAWDVVRRITMDGQLLGYLEEATVVHKFVHNVPAGPGGAYSQIMQCERMTGGTTMVQSPVAAGGTHLAMAFIMEFQPWFCVKRAALPMGFSSPVFDTERLTAINLWVAANIKRSRS